MFFTSGRDSGIETFFLIGDGLSHVAFGAMAIASVLNITNNMLFILPVTVVCAIFLLRAGQIPGSKVMRQSR